MEDYLQTKKFIIQQTIFQKYSTVDALVYFTELVRGELKENKFTTCAYLNLSKAFEQINHTKQ